MLTTRSHNRVTFFLLGCVTSAMVLLTGASHPGNVSSLDLTQQTGTFADLKLGSCDIQHAESPRCLIVAKNGRPLVSLFENHSGEVTRFSVMNGPSEIVAIGELDDQHVSTLAVYGNPAGKKKRTPVLLLDGRDTSGCWETATYAATQPPGNRDYYPMVGDMYQDIDVDGLFDAKRVYNAKSEVISESIFLEGSWKEICRVTEDGVFLQVGQLRSEDHEAFLTQGEQRTHYVFTPGVGWKIDSTEPSSVKWRIKEGHVINGQTLVDDMTKIRLEQEGVLTRYPERKDN